MLKSNIKFYIKDENERILDIKIFQDNFKSKRLLYSNTMGKFTANSLESLDYLRGLIKWYPPGTNGSVAKKFIIQIHID